jgi:hypothetical protein
MTADQLFDAENVRFVLMLGGLVFVFGMLLFFWSEYIGRK